MPTPHARGRTCCHACRYVTPRALSTRVYMAKSGEVMCDVLEWRAPGSRGRWKTGWAAIVRGGEDDRRAACYFACYRRLMDAQPQKLVQGPAGCRTAAVRDVAPTGSAVAGKGVAATPRRSDQIEIVHSLVLSVWGESPRTILMQSATDAATALLVRLPDGARLEQWMAALVEVKQASLRAQLAAGDTAGAAGLDGITLVGPSMTNRWGELRSYVGMLATEASQLDQSSWEMLQHALDGTLVDQPRAELVRELTHVFMALALGDQPMPMCTSMERDARWRRFTQAWCRFILRFVPPPRLGQARTHGGDSIFGKGSASVSIGDADAEPPSATTLVLAILLCCRIGPAIETFAQHHRLKVCMHLSMPQCSRACMRACASHVCAPSMAPSLSLSPSAGGRARDARQ